MSADLFLGVSIEVLAIEETPVVTRFPEAAVPTLPFS
jgi:hypothetical protein